MAPMLTADQVAEILAVSKARVYELARQGILPQVRLGREIRFNPERLAEWIKGGGQALPGVWRREAILG